MTSHTTRAAYIHPIFTTLTNKEFMLLSPRIPRLPECALDLLLEGTQKEMKTSKADDMRRESKWESEGGERKVNKFGQEKCRYMYLLSVTKL